MKTPTLIAAIELFRAYYDDKDIDAKAVIDNIIEGELKEADPKRVE